MAVRREAPRDAPEAASPGPLSSSDDDLDSPPAFREASAGAPAASQPASQPLSRRAGAAVARRAQSQGHRRRGGEGSELGGVPARARNWVQGLGSVIVAAGWGEVGAVVPDARHWRLLRSQVRLVLRQLPLLERAGIGALAGGLAGGFTNATLHPIDTVKTKLQARGAAAVYSGPMDVVRKLSAAQGLAGFYRGLPAALVGSFVSSAIYFGTYELSKGLLSRSVVLPFNPLRLGQGSAPPSLAPEDSPRSPLSPLADAFSKALYPPETSPLPPPQEADSSQPKLRLRLPPLLIPPLSAALGNVASSAILVPKELIKQRLQAGASGTSLQVLQQTLREEGVRGLYTGYSAALLRNLPTNVINFSLFEYLKAGVLASAKVHGGPSTLQAWQSMLCGAASGMTSSALTTPLDVVKTRLMTQARASLTQAGLSGAQVEVAAKAQATAAYTYAGVAAMLESIFKEEGARGLLTGMGPRILYGACFSAVGFFSYEAARIFLLRAHIERKIPRMISRGEGHSTDSHAHHRTTHALEEGNDTHDCDSDLHDRSHDHPHVSPPHVGRGLGH